MIVYPTNTVDTFCTSDISLKTNALPGEIYLILSSIFKLSNSLKLMTRMLCYVTPINRQTSRDHTLPDNLLLETNTSYTSRGHALPDNLLLETNPSSNL